MKLAKFIKYCQTINIQDPIDLTPSDIRNFLIHLDHLGHNHGGMFAFFKVIRSFLYWYEDENDLQGWSNPNWKVKVKSPKDTPLEPADINAVKAILKTCGKNYTGIRDRAILLMLLDTGIHASELIALDHENVNSITDVAQILYGKGGKFRTVYLSKKLG